MSDLYILDENSNPIQVASVKEWGAWIEKNKDYKKVCRDELPNGTCVSTVFLGMDHRFGDGAPLLWETMIFGGQHDQYQDRYTSRAAAVEGHAKALKMAEET